MSVNCYCTPEAEAEMKTRIKDLEFSGIHFLDSGNYHYLSKFWIEKIEKPFSPLVFDHHTDMQEASFWGLAPAEAGCRSVFFRTNI